MVVSVKMTLIYNQNEKNHTTSKLSIDSIFGKGFMYVTESCIVLESINKDLIYFEMLHNQIAKLKALSNSKIEITWVEDGVLQKFIFRCSNALSTVKIITEKNNYQDNFPDLLQNNITTLSEGERKKIIDKRTLSCDKKIKEYEMLLSKANDELSLINTNESINHDLTIKQSLIISDLNNMLSMWNRYKIDIQTCIINRNINVPQNISKHLCWYDCWYDEKLKLYITLNSKFFNDFPFDFDKVVKKFNKDTTIPNVCAIPEKFVGFSKGYPVVLSKYVKEMFPTLVDSKVMPNLVIPSLTDEMLTDELISMYHGVSVNINQVKESYNDIPKSILYYINDGSRIILTDDTRCKYSQKEREFLELRDLFPKELNPLLP